MLAACIEELPYQAPMEMARLFSEEKGTVFLHSAKPDADLARYSFLGVWPYETLIAKNRWIQYQNKAFMGNVFDIIQQKLKQNQFEPFPDLPPFQGGGMGYFSYDLNQLLERIPLPRQDDNALPDCVFGFYDLVFAWDHLYNKLYLFSTGLPYQGKQRLMQAKRRQEALLKFISKAEQPRISTIQLLSDITSNFSKNAYLKAVKKAIDYIYSGDIFEVNLSQRFEAQVESDAFSLYNRLQAINPAPFSGLLNFEACQIISSSPERFLKLQNLIVETCPIKGTRRRGSTPKQDRDIQAELLASEKDRAENIMIVDLMRNDLSRVSEPHSVKVPILCGLQSFATVHHLVSTVTSKLAPSYDAIDLIKASFPGGSITGAPKIRAMEIIAEIEPTARGPYCGSMGYIGFDGSMDLSILIRTYTLRKNQLTFQAGGAITADSDPNVEYQETLDKAAALKKVLYS